MDMKGEQACGCTQYRESHSLPEASGVITRTPDRGRHSSLLMKSVPPDEEDSSEPIPSIFRANSTIDCFVMDSTCGHIMWRHVLGSGCIPVSNTL